jgi:hypothetical protein
MIWMCYPRLVIQTDAGLHLREMAGKTSLGDSGIEVIMNRTNIRIALVLGILAVFAGCSSDDDPVTPPTVTSMVRGTVAVQPWGDLEGIEITLSGAASHTTLTGSDGQYEFSKLANGSYTVEMTNPPAHVVFEHSSHDFTVSNSSQVVPADVFGVLTVSGQVTGIISIDGSPVADIQVNLNGSTFTGEIVGHTDHSAADGRYHFNQVPGGSYQLQAISPVWAQFPDEGVVLFKVESADTTVTIDYAGVARTRSQIWGEVEVNGIGEPGVQVNLTGDASAEITTDANGFFKFRDLDLGNYTVTITPPAGTTFSEESKQTVFTNPRVEIMIFNGTRP